MAGLEIHKPKTKGQNAAPEWRFKDFFDDNGGPEGVQQIILAEGFKPPPVMTVVGWRHRNSIPSKWLLVLMLAASRRNKLKTLLVQLTPEASR